MGGVNLVTKIVDLSEKVVLVDMTVSERRAQIVVPDHIHHQARWNSFVQQRRNEGVSKTMKSSIGNSELRACLSDGMDQPDSRAFFGEDQLVCLKKFATALQDLKKLVVNADLTKLIRDLCPCLEIPDANRSGMEINVALRDLFGRTKNASRFSKICWYLRAVEGFRTERLTARNSRRAPTIPVLLGEAVVYDWLSGA